MSNLLPILHLLYCEVENTAGQVWDYWEVIWLKFGYAASQTKRVFFSKRQDLEFTRATPKMKSSDERAKGR